MHLLSYRISNNGVNIAVNQKSISSSELRISNLLEFVPIMCEDLNSLAPCSNMQVAGWIKCQSTSMISYAQTSFVNSILVYNRSPLVVIHTNWNPVVKSLWNVPSLSCFLWQRKIGCSQWMHNPSYEIFQLVAQSSSWSTHSYWTCRQRERGCQLMETKTWHRHQLAFLD